MPEAISFFDQCAHAVHRRIIRTDVRLLVACVSVGGVLAWGMPWQVTVFFCVLAAIIAATAVRLLREARAALAAYGLFILLWTVSQLVLFLWEFPGEVASAFAAAALLGAKLFTLLGLALAVPMAATPLMLGRTLSWYLGWVAGAERWLCAAVFRGKVRPVAAGGIWRAALALSLMMAFFPRSLRAMNGLRRSLALRAPHLKLHARVALLGLALVRIVSAQTWDMALAVASRDVYRPEPWAWGEGRKRPAAR